MQPATIFAFLPAVHAQPESVVRTLRSLRKSATSIAYFHLEDEEAPLGPDVKAITVSSATIGTMIEAGRNEVSADLYLWIPPGVRVLEGAIEEFAKAYAENPQASLIVSDYQIESQGVNLFPLKDDLTEREDFGVVLVFPAWALQKVNGADPNLRYATFYDLRLKLAEVGEIAHIKTPCFQVIKSEESGGNNDASDLLFYPGRGKFGGFSYLFMDPEEEKETEDALLACLKRRNAFLDKENDIAPDSPWKESDPIISVVIPVYNRAKYLPMAIESVFRGKLQNFEIIVVDNASTDNTLEVAKSYEAKDKRVHVYSNEENVIAKALNLGISKARGKYICQLDSDDEYTDNTLQSMVDHFESHPKCGLAISYYELMNEEGKTLEEFGVIEHLEYSVNNILRVDGAGAVRCWRKGVLEEFGGFNETDFPNYGEDYDLVLKAGEKYDVDRIHEVLYRYRRHADNTDVLRRPEDKITAKTFARSRAIERRQKINEALT
ncbi:glycosyltransferase [bacterium]|nr:glycosyltransferase [bacterium]